MKNNVFMKIVLNIIQCCCFIFILNICFGCKNEEGEAGLTIIDQSSITLTNVTWRSTSFGNLSPGDTVTKTVNGIKDFKVGMDFYKGDVEWFTDEEIQVDPGTHLTFIFTDNTKIHTYK